MIHNHHHFGRPSSRRPGPDPLFYRGIAWGMLIAWALMLAGIIITLIMRAHL